jgi:uncharacterized protein (DUF169 family)
MDMEVAVEPERNDYRSLEGYLKEMLGISDSPIGFHYTADPPAGAMTVKQKSRVCIYPFLNQARRGKTVYFSREWKACRGGAFYLGYKKSLMKGIGHFISTGIPGRLEGERFKKTPELGDEVASSIEYIPADAEHIVFKPLGEFTPSAPPEVGVIFGNADVMGAMIVMANYARPGSDAVKVQFSSGCYSIITEPRRLKQNGEERAVLGSFDVACRPYLDPCEMTFAASMDFLWDMTGDMGESFLNIDPYKKIRGRKARGA